MRNCKRCGGANPEVHLGYAKLSLCFECFKEFYERKVRETILKYKMLGEKERVLVAVSGGKDSGALLFVLRRLFPKLSITALHINMGIPTYSEECESKFRELVRMVDVDSIVYDVRRELGIVVPDFLKTVYAGRICSPCSTLKRYLMNRIAWENGFTKLATGHNLDDTVEVLFNLYLQGDVLQLIRLKPVLPSTHPKLVAKIKPLIEMTEEENFFYAQANGIPVKGGKCPFAGESRSQERKRGTISAIEKEIRGFKHLFFSSHVKRLLPALERNVELPTLRECEKCGMPSTESLCAFCRRVEIARKAY